MEEWTGWMKERGEAKVGRREKDAGIKGQRRISTPG